MKRLFAYLPLVLLFSASGSLAWSQAAKTHKAAGRVDTSKAHAWAEAVTDFITERRILEQFPIDEVEERFKALIPREALIVIRGNGLGDGGGESLLGNPEKGVLQLYYELGQNGNGLFEVESVRIYMPGTDPDGVDVLSRVVSSMRRKLRPPWDAYSPARSFYIWDQREALLSVKVQAIDKLPDRRGGREPDGGFIKGSWIFVSFGHVPEPEYAR